MAIMTPIAGRHVSDELKVKIKLMKIMQNHSIPVVAEKEFYEWAIESDILKDIYATAPEIEGDGFEQHLIDCCYKKLFGADVDSHKQMYVRLFQKALHSLLTNVMLIKEENLSIPHAEDPTLPVRYPELLQAGNINIDELHLSRWWIDTWEKICKTDSNEILVPL
eukprot:jgi/Psemu1/6394/gm1.6394_g